MSQRISMIALLGAVSLTVACGSDGGSGGAASTGGAGGSVSSTSTGGAAGTGAGAGTGGASGAADAAGPQPAVYPACVGGDNGRCDPRGFPFVTQAVPYSDKCFGATCLVPPPAGGTTIHLSQPETGTLCLSGIAASAMQQGEQTDGAPVAMDGGAGVLLLFTTFSESHAAGDLSAPGAMVKVLKTFNADALGITQMEFTIDRPPAKGVLMTSDTIKSLDCQGRIGPTCLTFGPDLPRRITESGRVTVSFAEFRSGLAPGQTFDTHALNRIGFDVGAGAYDFCLSDFKFLDANGVEVPDPDVKP